MSKPKKTKPPMVAMNAAGTMPPQGHLGGFRLMPTKPGVCPECAVDHAPDAAHNQQSLAYQYHFYNRFGRWPTWADAIAHCAPEIQAAWEKGLKERGVEITNAEKDAARAALATT